MIESYLPSVLLGTLKQKSEYAFKALAGFSARRAAAADVVQSDELIGLRPAPAPPSNARPKPKKVNTPAAGMKTLGEMWGASAGSKGAKKPKEEESSLRTSPRRKKAKKE